MVEPDGLGVEGAETPNRLEGKAGGTRQLVGTRPNRSLSSVVVRPSRERSAVRLRGTLTGLP
jgi:hypothetical protein